MSFNFPIKRQNHRVHPCKVEQKLELLSKLIDKNADKNIVVITCKDTNSITASLKNNNVTVFNDSELSQEVTKKYDLLISFDLPQSVKLYMLRILHVESEALILLDPSEQHILYPIETVLKRVILQEIIEGFDPTPVVEEVIEKKFEPKKSFDRDNKSFDRDKRKDTRGDKSFKKEWKPRDNSKPYGDKKTSYDKKPYEGSKKPYEGSKSNDDRKPYSGTKKPKSKYVGDDEYGKPMFSAKSGERNHRYSGEAKSDSEKADYKAKQSRARSYDKDKKPWENKKPYSNDRKPSDRKPTPKSSGKKIVIKSLKIPKK